MARAGCTAAPAAPVAADLKACSWHVLQLAFRSSSSMRGAAIDDIGPDFGPNFPDFGPNFV